MLNLERTIKRTGERISAIGKSRAKELRRQMRERDRAIEKIQGAYDKQVQELDTATNARKQEVEDSSHRRTAYDILTELADNYKVLDGRSVLASISEELMEKARGVIKLSSEAEEPGRKIIDGMVGILGGEVGNVIKALTTSGTEPRDIVSYIGAFGNTGYIAIPVITSPADLGKNLETKLDEVLDTGEITLGLNGTVHKSGVVQVADAEVQGFRADLEETPSGFVMYSLSPLTPTLSSDELAQALAEKFNAPEIQPGGFKKSNLTHRVLVVPGEALNLLRNSTTESLYSPLYALEDLSEKGIEHLTEEDAAQILGKKVSTIRRLNTLGNLEGTAREGTPYISVSSLMDYVSGNAPVTRGAVIDAKYRRQQEKDELYRGRREEAYARMLEQKDPERFSSEDVRRVLGSEGTCGAIKVMKKLGAQKDESSGRWYVPSESLKRFLDTHKPTDKGWRNIRG